MNSNYTGRFARSMQEGINPYASGPINPMPEQREPLSRRFADWALYIAAVLAIVVVVGVAV